MTSLNQSENIALTLVDSSDSESDDELSQNHKKKKPIESKSTIDTTEPMQLGEFIEMGSKVEAKMQAYFIASVYGKEKTRDGFPDV